jgi:short-subunit dehydrogenase
MVSFSGQTIVVTGASGGLGTVMSHAFAGLEANLALVAWPGLELEALRNALRHRGARAISIIADLRDAQERRRAIQAIYEEFGTIDVLINNAGVELTGAYHEQTEQDILDVVAVNLEAAMILTRLVLPEMVKRSKGHIVNISSLAGKGGPAYEEVYAATKAGLIAFTSSLRATYKGTGVSASVIVPGFVEAGIYAHLKEISGCKAPAILGTSQPDKVASAVIRAILRDKPEIIINPTPVRPLVALINLFPSFGEWLVDKIGTNDFFRRVVKASAEKTDNTPRDQLR